MIPKMLYRKNKEIEEVEREFDEIISFAENEYGDHEGVRRQKIVRWLAQFPRNSRGIAAKALRALSYYSTSNIRSMTKQLVSIVYSEYEAVDKGKTYFVPVGGPGSGAQIIARIIKSIKNIPARNIITMADIEKLRPQDTKAIILIDDFSGTGQTIKDWWPTVEPLILPKEANVALGVLVLNHRARSVLEGVVNQIFSVTDLEAHHDVFHQKCNKFNKNEKELLLASCKRTKCREEFIRGYGDCGLLVVFKHGCPNNSLPILWHEKANAWEPLFQRRAI